MTRNEYLRHYSTGHARNHGRPTIVPDDVKRVDEHEPCFFCGTRAGLPCKHRKLAA